MTWLVTGGAGYIGAHVVRALRADGQEVVVLDDLSTGASERVPEDVPLVRAGLLDGPGVLDDVLRTHQVDGVVHLAAKKSVPESVAAPLHYFEQNVGGSVALLDAAVRCGVRRVLYSSTAAVYGEPTTERVDERAGTVPTNPYGESKLAAEWVVRRTAAAHGLAWTALRYFNVAGAAAPMLADGGRTNLMPLALAAAAGGEPVQVFGSDWPTRDGTCLRDYVDVADLADAHVVAARALEGGSLAGGVLNVGRDVGVSVRELLDTVAAVTGRAVPRVAAARRPGDPAAVVADVSAIAARLGWRAERGVEEMVRGAWSGFGTSPLRPPCPFRQQRARERLGTGRPGRRSGGSQPP